MNGFLLTTVKTFTVTLVFSAILFLSAGTLDHAPAWWYLWTTLLTSLFNVLSLRGNPALMNERSAPGDGTKEWDKRILGRSFLMSIATIIIGGLDSGRFHWSSPMPFWTGAAGAAMVLGGNGLFLLARNQNLFFSTVARIQHDRGHRVVDTGLYRIVRHPGYLGMSLATAGLPFLLSSAWSGVPVLVSLLLLVRRTALEDRMLAEELDGYSAYQRQTTYRLIPMVW